MGQVFVTYHAHGEHAALQPAAQADEAVAGILLSGSLCRPELGSAPCGGQRPDHLVTALQVQVQGQVQVVAASISNRLWGLQPGLLVRIARLRGAQPELLISNCLAGGSTVDCL